MSAPSLTIAGGPESIDTGVYMVNAPCPRCGVVEEILVAIRSVLTTPEDGPGSLRVKIKGKARDHDCPQLRLTDGGES
jgi:hypothetical protein